MKEATPIFDTLHVRLNRPLCKCRATQEPDRNAYAIYFPVDESGLSGVKVECKICNKFIVVPWSTLTGAVVYTKRWTPPEAERERLAAVAKRMGTETDTLARLWQTAPDVAAFFKSEPREYEPPPAEGPKERPSESQEEDAPEPGSPQGTETAPEMERASETGAPEPETFADTRPAYMKTLGLEEQR